MQPRVVSLISVVFQSLMLIVNAKADLMSEQLRRWIEEIDATKQFGLVAGSPDYEALVESGPAILPALFEEYRHERDPAVLYHLRMLIKRVGHFSPFLYSTEPVLIGDRQMQYDGAKPTLSEKIGPGALESLDSVPENRDALVQWWDQRHSFLNRPGAAAEIRAVTGTSTESYASFSAADAREFDKFKVYGIYNLPLLVELVAEDNNPVAFVEFLRSASHELYQTLEMTGDLVANAARVTEVYPAAEDKLAVICAWWQSERGKYTGLDPLQKAIDDSVNTACTKVK